MHSLKETVFVLFLITMISHASSYNNNDAAFSEAIDTTLSLLSSTTNPSNNSFCIQNIKELMIRNDISTTIQEMRNNNTDAQLMRLGILAAIALVSPWNQDAQGKFIISDRGVLMEDYHPSSSESDIMLCVVCTLLAIIVLFHVTSAQLQYVTSKDVAATTVTK
jgi:hypothetical protein